MLRARWRLTAAISVVALECTWGSFNDSGQKCPDEPGGTSTPMTDCSSNITAVTLSSPADTIQVGRGAPLSGRIAAGNAVGNCYYNTFLSSSDWTIASLFISNMTWYSADSSAPPVTISAVLGLAPGTATITQLGGNRVATITTTVIPTRDAFVAVSAGGSGACTLDPAGRVYCSTASVSAAPLLVGGLPALTSLEAGPGQACGVSTGKRLYCWANSGYPFLPGDAAEVVLPADAAAVDPGGTSHGCVLAATHDVYCWGSNASGQRGVPGEYGYLGTGASLSAVFGGHRFVKVAVGGDHSCGLGDDGSLWCWGSNVWGELGVSTVSEGCPAAACQPSPIRVRLAADSVFTDVTAGFNHTCALDTAGHAYCWGNNSSGALGTGDTLSGSAPRAVAGNLTFVSLTAGSSYTCGLAASGDAYCWGLNAVGQLGSGPSSGSCGSSYYSGPCETAPVKVSGGLAFSSLSAGSFMTCGMTGTGAWCWGEYWGASSSPSYVPVRVPGQR